MILVAYTTTVYMVLVVVLKLQLISDGVMTSHSVGDGGSGLISTVTESVNGVYIVDEGSPYCNIDGKSNTVEPPNKGQLGTRHFVRCSEVGLSWRSTNFSLKIQ